MSYALPFAGLLPGSLIIIVTRYCDSWISFNDGFYLNFKLVNMKRAIKALAFTQTDDYFGEFHTVGKRLKLMTPDTQFVIDKFEKLNV